MASELSKLIEDQLQKHDEEAPMSPTEKQRLLSSSLRIKTSPGRKQEKRTPIVKLSKEQPAPPSITGTSVPVPSGQSWVREDTQKFTWTKWRIILAVCTVFAIAIALLVAFSHPSSRMYQPAIGGVMQGNTTAKPILGGLLGTGKPAKAKAPQAAPAMAAYRDPSLGFGTQSKESPLGYGSQAQESSLGYGSQPLDPSLGYGSQHSQPTSETSSSWGFSGTSAAKEEGSLAMGAPGGAGAAEAAPGSVHHKAHSGHPHGQHHAHQQQQQQQQHGAAGFGGAHAGAAGLGVTPSASVPPKFGAGASAATFGAAMKDMAAAALQVPGLAPARAPAAALLPPASVPAMAPGPQAASKLAPAAALLNAKLAPGPALAARKFGKSAAVFGVGGVAGNTPSLNTPVQGGYPSTEAWDNIHGGGVGSLEQRQGVEGVASVAGGPGTMLPADEDEEWADEETSEDLDGEAGIPGQSYAEEDDYGG